MKPLRTLSIGAAALLVGLAPAALHAAEPAAGYVDFGKLPPPAEGRFVEVNIRSHLIAMVARLTEKEEPEVAAMLRNLQSVRVNVIGLNEQNRPEMEERIRAITERLDSEGWERVVEAREKKQQVSIQMKTRGAESVLGVLVAVIEEGKEAVLVNVVGDIRPEQLATIGERFNIEPLKKLQKQMGGAKAKAEHTRS